MHVLVKFSQGDAVPLACVMLLECHLQIDRESQLKDPDYLGGICGLPNRGDFPVVGVHYEGTISTAFRGSPGVAGKCNQHEPGVAHAATS